MKCRYAFTKALLCMVSLAPMAQATAQEHDHHHAAAAVAAPAQRWTPDAPLREGMRRAHVAVEQLHRDETGRMSAAKVVEHAVRIEQAVTFMYANCRLSEQPDAALHGILVPLLRAAQVLKQDPHNRRAVADMREAIAHYPQYFNDPDWDAASATPGIHDGQ
ncbi:DnrO protein [Rhodanobacter ginsengisoli]|uniref:DnrO protein n=1 Tax=Rhodanobacter ginsengisoli TaxID=418646 RepID=A0ABW0QVP8_9GAMM